MRLVKNLKSGNLVTVKSLLAGNAPAVWEWARTECNAGVCGETGSATSSEPLPNVGGWGLTVEKALGSGVGSDSF